MRIITLLENTLSPGMSLIAKHGLSIYIETEEKKLLFDVGPDEAFLENAQAMGVDLSKVDILVISHAHQDHGGGLEEFLKINTKAQVYLSTYVQEEYYVQRASGELKYIGLSQDVLQTYSERVQYIGERTTTISSGITLLPNTEHATFKPSAILLKKEEGILVEDSYEHELILVIEEKEVLHVFTGCSHNGIINMVMSVKKEFPGRKIQTLIGGFHIMNTSTGEMREKEETVRDIAEALREHDIDQIYTGHCTGVEALGVMQKILGKQISDISSGKKIEL